MKQQKDQGEGVEYPRLDIAHERCAAEVIRTPKRDLSALEGDRKKRLHGVEQSVNVTEEKRLALKQDRMKKKKSAKEGKTGDDEELG
jgi:hypothetical protein